MTVLAASIPSGRRTDVDVCWLPTRPDLTVQLSHSTSRNCQHVSCYEVISKTKLPRAAFGALADAGLFGFGQDWRVLPETPHDGTELPTLIDHAPAVVVKRGTREVLTDVEPTNYFGQPVTTEHPFSYFVYRVERYCDSGD